MDLWLKRKRDLEAGIIEDYGFLKKLEDALRYEDDPMRRGRLRRQIQDLNKQITARQTELETLTTRLRGTAIGLANEVQDYLVLTGWCTRDDLVITPEGEVELSIERREGLFFQRVLIRCTTDEANYLAFQRLRRTMSKRDIPIGWLIAESRVDPVVRELTANCPAVRILSLDEFFTQFFSLDAYFAWLRGEYQRRHIGEYYVDLACTKPTFDEEGREIGRARYDPVDDYIDRWLEDQGMNQLSILGDFGMGKTWFCWHYAYKQMKRYLKNPARARIPLLMPLRDYRRRTGVQQLFSDFFFRRHKINLTDYGVFEALNRRGRFLILLDGFDEMAHYVDYQAVVANFWDLAEIVAPGTKVILTCRTSFFRYTQEAREVLGSAEGLPRVELADRPRFEVLRLEEFDSARAQAALVQRLGERAARATWSRIQTVYDLPDLVKRPILMAIIVETRDELSGVARTSRVTLYEKYITRCLKKNVDEERTPLTLNVLQRLMEEIAWEMVRQGSHSLHYAELLSCLDQSAREEEWNVKPEFLDQAGRTEGILTRSNDAYFQFSHRSFEEFLVARKAIRLIREGKALDTAMARNIIQHNIFEFVDEFIEKMPAETDRDSLLELLDSTDPSTRAIAVQCLRWLADKTILELLEARTGEESNILVQTGLIFTILHYADLAKTNKYLEFIKARERIFADVYLEYCGGSAMDVVRYATKRLQQEEYSTKAPLYIHMLGLFGSKSSIVILRGMLESENRILRDGAAEAITRIRQREILRGGPRDKE